MILPLFLALLSAAGPAPRTSLVISPCEAGEHRQFEVVDCEIELKNTGERAITISQGEARLPWDRIDTSKIVVAPKSTSYIKATVDLRNDEGEIRRAFRFATDEPGQERRGSEVRAFVIPLLDQSKPKLDFGVVRLGEGVLPMKSIELTSKEVENFRITGIESKPDWLDASIGADARTISAKLRDSVPWGVTRLGQAYIKLRTDAAMQPKVWVEVNANVLGDVVPDSNPFQLGLLRSEGKHEFLLRISSRSGREFKFGELKIENIEAKAVEESCTPAAPGCKLIRIDVSNDQPSGKLEGILKVDLPMLGKVIAVDLVGMLLTPETKIHQLDDLVKKSTEKAGGMSSASATPSDIGRAIQETIREEAPPPPGNGPLLRWSVAHQEPIYGYAIYRANSKQGPYVRINDELIHVLKEGSDKAGRYQWRDDSAQSGQTYWYRIGIINRDGSRRDLTGSQKVFAK